MEAKLATMFRIKSMRATFAQIACESKVDEQSNALFFRGKEIGLVYYRTGYSVEQYVSNDEEQAYGIDKWKVREMLETTMPIKLPSIDY
jgi:hypothetical protein